MPSPALRRPVVLLAAAALAAQGCGSASRPSGPREGARAQAACARAMPEVGLVDLTDLSPSTEPMLARALDGAGRAASALRGVQGDPVARLMVGDLERARALSLAYLRLHGGDRLDEAAARFEDLKRFLAQVQSDAALHHAPSCAVHALLD